MTYYGHTRAHRDAKLNSLRGRHVYNRVTFKKSELPVSHFDMEQLINGVIVEKEHNNDIGVRIGISQAHLVESSDYYRDALFKEEINSVSKTERARLRKEIEKYSQARGR